MCVLFMVLYSRQILRISRIYRVTNKINRDRKRNFYNSENMKIKLFKYTIRGVKHKVLNLIIQGKIYRRNGRGTDTIHKGMDRFNND